MGGWHGDTVAQTAANSPLSRLEIISGNYPKAFIFWSTTRRLVTNSTVNLSREFLALQGVTSSSASEHWNKFLQFKSAHPTKLVYLFTQGHVFSEFPSQYDPIDRSLFFAGHWVHFEGCRVTSDIRAESGETEITVETPRLFRIQTIRENRLLAQDDIVLCRLNAQGRPDWNTAEQVRLVSKDETKKTLKIRRGLYGTKPLAFASNKTWAAAHAYQPWGSDKGVSWVVNYSPHCPRDARGRTAADILLEQFSALFQPGGRLHAYDGLEFDVMMGTPNSVTDRGRRYDTDGDGVGDDGYRDGLNVYGNGVYDFARRLRERLGPHKLIMGDGSPKPEHQRCFGLFNGIESEWWPQWNDMDVTHWSSGINLHEFWKQNSHPPYFSYFVHKIGGHSLKEWQTVPFNLHRLVLAVAQFVDAAVTSFHPASGSSRDTVSIFDELRAGAERKAGWLGKPLGSAVALALQRTDSLNAVGALGLARKLAGDNCRVEPEPEAVRITGNTGATSLKFSLSGLRCQGEDLFVRFAIKAAPTKGVPDAIARHLTVALSSGSPEELATYANSRWFETGFYFRKVKDGDATLRFEVEGNEPVWISNLTVHTAPDVRYRLFERGLVLANPSDHPVTLDLNTIAPGIKFARLQGASDQDPKINNGQPVTGAVTLGARDGLFLRRLTATR